MSDRAEFRFVVDGMELDDEQRAAVASAVQEAGIRAITSFKIRSPILTLDLGRVKGWQIDGGRVLLGALADEIGGQLAQIEQLHEGFGP